MATATERATTAAAAEDFYEVEALLEPADRQLVHRVRDFMRAEVQPIINDYWTRAEFPFEILPGLRDLGIVGLAYSGYGFPGRSHLVGRFVADSEAIYSYEGTREINSLIVGRAITGISAFV